jgi:2-C-methyl-D-erythritol 4-phosphate cytidylyltransferase
MYSDSVAIILSGGKGMRFGKQKQYVIFNKKPLWKHVYDKVSAVFPNNNICVVGNDAEAGKTRSCSVINGLRYFANRFPKPEKVIILEAARPLVTIEQINILMEYKEPSCAFVTPVVNAIIKRDGTYVDRADYYEMVAPQAFDYMILKEAYEKKEAWDFNDETRVVYEYSGIKAKLIETGQNLFKVTYPHDLIILNELIKLYPVE